MSVYNRSYWLPEKERTMITFPAWEHDRWQDVPQNPLIGPVDKSDDAVIGDPQLILPGEFDDKWHLFSIGHGHFYRFDSVDGINWELVYDLFWKSGPTCVTCDGTQWIACYSYHWKIEDVWDSTICARTSTDLVNWSEPVELITAEYDWEIAGPRIQVRNPNLVILRDGTYRLYYSGGTVLMPDMGFEEPKYVSFADADNPFGPYKKHGKPILSPDPDIWYRNHAAGAMKVFGLGDAYLGLANGIYFDESGNTRSAIDVLLSEDGVVWEDAPYNPIVRPATAWWKDALVYQLDICHHDNKLKLYYNAREGWPAAKEWMGCSVLDAPDVVPTKLWELPPRP